MVEQPQNPNEGMGTNVPWKNNRENCQNVIMKLNYQFMDSTNKRLCTIPIIITIIDERIFDSHKNNFNLNCHTDCVFAVRIPSFIHHPRGHLEYTHQNVRLLLECHHQNAKCVSFCWVRWLSCLLTAFYCLSEVYVADIHISSPKRDKGFHLPSPKHGWCSVATHFSGDVHGVASMIDGFGRGARRSGWR